MDPIYGLLKVQSMIQEIDPRLIRSLLVKPCRPDEPFVLEYLDRFITAVQERMDSGRFRARRAMPMIVALRELRDAWEEGLSHVEPN